MGDPEIMQVLIRKFPTLDVTWPEQVQSAWWRAFDRFVHLLREIEAPRTKNGADEAEQEAQRDGGSR